MDHGVELAVNVIDNRYKGKHLRQTRLVSTWTMIIDIRVNHFHTQLVTQVNSAWPSLRG